MECYDQFSVTKPGEKSLHLCSLHETNSLFPENVENIVSG